MSTKYRALIWEQNRVAAVAAVWCLFVALAILVTLRIGVYANWFSLRDAAHLALVIYFLTGVGTGLVLLLRQDPEGHLIVDFERRLARLPLATFGLVTVPLLLRLLYLSCVCGCLWLVHSLLFEESLSGSYAAWSILCYLLAQAYTWSRRSLTGSDYLWPLGILLVFLAVMNTALAKDRPEFDPREMMAHIPAAVTVLIGAGAYALALLGVTLERRDARVGLPSTEAIWEWFVTRGATADRRFVSAFEAQLWYERKRTSWILPLFTFIALAILATFVLTLHPGGSIWQLSVKYLAPIALVLAALPAGMQSSWTKSHYGLLRPEETRMFARVRLLATLESLLFSFALVCACTVLLLFTAGADELRLLQSAYQQNEVSLMEMAGLRFAPCLAAAVIAWILLEGRQTVMGLLLICGGAFAVYMFLGNFVFQDPNEVESSLFWITCAALLLLPLELLWAANRLRVINRATVMGALMAWVVLAVLLWMLGPATEHPALMLLLCFIPAGVLIRPILSVPIEIHQQRTS